MSDTSLRILLALNTLRCAYLGKRDHLQICKTAGKNGSPSRPEEWFHEQEARLKDIRFAGAEFALIADNLDSYLVWREGVEISS